MSEITKKKICIDCGLEKNEVAEFYLSRIINQERMDICKDCFIKEVINSEDIYQIFKKYNIPFFYNLWFSIVDYNSESTLKEYMKIINSLSQYKYKEWKDSVLTNSSTETEETSFYDSIVNNLKKEANKLSNRLIKLSNGSNINNDYIVTIKSLKETLDLISRYDWKLMYSEYKVKDDNDNMINQVSIWESNHENQIRNHKYWNTCGERVDVPNML